MTSAATGITSTIQLTGDITPPNPNTAIVEINAKNAGSTLVIDGTSNGYSIGTLALPMSKIKFTGDGTIEVTAISTSAIEVSVSKLAIAEVDSDVFFTGPATLAGVQINGDIDFQGNAANVVLASDTANNLPALISGNITSTGTQNGTIEFMDDGTIGTVDSNGVSTNTITNIAMLKAGADNSTVTVNSGGNISIGEIQGTGTGTIVFTQPTNLTGGINLTSGSAVNLTFDNGGSISNDVGTGSEVGNITLQAGEMIFSGKGEGNIFYIVPGNGAKLDTRDDFNFKIVVGTPPSLSPSPFHPVALVTVVNDSFWAGISNEPETYKDDVASAAMPLDIFQVDGSDVTFLGTAFINNLNFTTTDSVTANFKGVTQIGGATTTGNGIHTIAISNDFTAGNSTFVQLIPLKLSNS